MLNRPRNRWVRLLFVHCDYHADYVDDIASVAADLPALGDEFANAMAQSVHVGAGGGRAAGNSFEAIGADELIGTRRWPISMR